MAILKYVYVGIGLIWYIFINIVSYTNPFYEAVTTYKVIFSTLSLVLFMINALFILYTERILKKPFKSLSLHTKIILIVGVVIIPIISLYY